MSKFSEYIGKQFGNPTGLVGKCCCMIMNTTNRAMYKSVVSKIKPEKESKVLDIGYGNGYLLQKIYNKFQSYLYGIDISEDMKKLALERNQKAKEAGKIELMVGDCCRLPYEADSFEVVTSVNTIYFWNDTHTGLSEIRRVLRENGRFINVVYSEEWLKKLSYTRKGFKIFSKDQLIQLGK